MNRSHFTPIGPAPKGWAIIAGCSRTIPHNESIKWENDDMNKDHYPAPEKWVSIVFMDGDDYETMIDETNNNGGSTDAAVEYLSQWDYGTESEHEMSVTESEPWGKWDTTHTVTHGGIEYVYATNHSMGYASLNRHPLTENKN